MGWWRAASMALPVGWILANAACGGAPPPPPPPPPPKPLTLVAGEPPHPPEIRTYQVALVTPEGVPLDAAGTAAFLAAFAATDGVADTTTSSEPGTLVITYKGPPEPLLKQFQGKIVGDLQCKTTRSIGSRLYLGIAKAGAAIPPPPSTAP